MHKADDAPLLPLQCGSGLRSAALQPERKLVAAILAQAVDIYCKTSGARARRTAAEHAEVEQWLFAEDEGRWPFTCRNVCDVLGIHLGRLRSELAGWKARALSRRRSAPRRRLAGRVRTARTH